MKIADDTGMGMDEMDRRLANLLGHEAPFAPNFDNTQLPSEATEQEIPPDVVAINVPDDKKMHRGFLLRTGQVSIAKALEKYAMLILTQDFTFIHIAKDGKVVSKKDNKKKHHGTIIVQDSSPLVEKTQPFTLALMRNQPTASFSLGIPIQEVLLYEPQPLRISSRRKSTPAPSSTNLYSPLLRQFLR